MANITRAISTHSKLCRTAFPLRSKSAAVAGVIRRNETMKFKWRSLISLKAPVIIAFILLWNSGILLAMYLGGGGLRGGLTPIGMEVTGYVCLVACLFSLSVARSTTVQSLVIAPSRAANFNSKEFYFLALLSGFLAISRFTFPVAEIGANAL